MAYTTVTEGMDDLLRQMEALGNAGRGAASAGLYEAAGVYADEVSMGIENISVEPFKYATGGRKRKPSPEEKAILRGAGAAGIAKFKGDGVSVNTSVGFNNAGYAPVNWNHMSSKARTNYKFKNGRATQSKNAGKGGGNLKPIPMIANAINSGTSFMDKQPFFRKAISRAKGKAEQAFEKTATAALDQAAQIVGQSGHVYKNWYDMATSGWKYGD